MKRQQDSELMLLVARFDLSRQDAVLVDVPIADPHPDRRRHALIAFGARPIPMTQALDLKLN